MPFENNLDFAGGATDATVYTGNVKPIVPFWLGRNWHLITRTVMPFVSTPSDGGQREFGVGDIAVTVYLSPEREDSGWFWGAGPALILPTGRDDALGTGKWSAGPTAAVVRQQGSWTFTLLTGHAWSFAGDPERSRFSATLLQPSVSFTTNGNTSFGADTSSTYDWTVREWTVPVELSVEQILKIGKQPLSVGLTARYGLWHPADGPSWGLVFTMTLAFPR